MYLVFDTETSGLWRDDLAWDHASQPDLAQLGAKLFDGSWKCTGSIVCLIKPDGWTMEPGAEAHHGITELRCARHGIPLVAALSALSGLTANARLLVGHHVEFDRKVIRAAIRKAGGAGLWWEKKAEAFFCTMETSAPVCQLPGQFGSFKFPSLEEAHRHFYPAERFETAHDAESDLLASARIFRALDQIGMTPVIAPVRR